MPQYSPLPRIELDPRNEAELVQAAAQRVYEASNATINDFSSGSPIIALLEGQAFAQSEFLNFANQFPEAVLVEWIGPFLGAQRRTGAGSVVDIEFTIDPRDDQFDVFAGYQITTDPNLTAGESIQFVTTERLVIPPGSSQGTVRAISVFRSADANVPANTITKSVTSLSGVTSVTNPQPAAGGQDPELLSEVKERFFSLIRRRNPVSAEDWLDFFSDALGPGTSCTVLPRRSEKGVYRYEENYVQTNPSVAFFVLNPDGTPITTAQQDALQTLIKWSLPVEFLGYVYPMEVDDVDFVMGLKYDPSKPYARNLPVLSETVRNNLFSVMTPNAVFPVDYDPSVSDVESALTATFPLTLGTTNQYIDPDVDYIHAYVTPVGMSRSEFKLSAPLPFENGSAIKAGDLLLEQGNTFASYYEALKDFTPVTNDKRYYVNTGDLDLEVIKALESGTYDTGDVISVNTAGELRVVLTPFTYRGVQTVTELENDGFLSEAKTFSLWSTGSFTALNDSGSYDPQIIEFDPSDTSYVTAIPTLPTATPESRRPGYPVYVVNRAFEVGDNTTSLGTVQNEGFVGSNTVTIHVLENGLSFTAGEYIKTPDPTEIQTGEITAENCFLDTNLGAIEVFAEVLTDFTFLLSNYGTYEDAIAALEEEGAIKVVNVVPFIDCNGQSSFAQKPFRYQARFAMGEYVRYRPEGGFSSDELEACVAQQEGCSVVTDACKKLLKAQLPLPTYYFVLKDFTPNTTDLDSLIEQEVIEEVPASRFTATYSVPIESTQYVYPATITTTMVNLGIITDTSDLTAGETVLVTNEAGASRGLYEWAESTWAKIADGLPTWREMFRFAPGDVASFRSGSEIRNYEATEHVTPILDLEVYYDNGVFKRTQNGETVKYIDSAYRMENIIYQNVNGALSFYRVTRSFTPPATRTVWNDLSVNTTPRIEELFGNTIKFVSEVECNETITSRLKDGASTSKLGTCQINLVSKSVGSITRTYVWESTSYSNQSPALSSFPGSTFVLPPVDYGNGTLAL